MDDSTVVHMFVCGFYCHIFHVFHVAHTKNRGIVWRSTRPLKVTWPRSRWMVPSSSSTHVQERATESVIRNAASNHPTRGGRIHFEGSTFVFSLSFWHRGQFPYKENGPLKSTVLQTLEFLLRPDISCWGRKDHRGWYFQRMKSWYRTVSQGMLWGTTILDEPRPQKIIRLKQNMDIRLRNRRCQIVSGVVPTPSIEMCVLFHI